ncbi:50S ribosomal protein L18 [Candidatus Micrarchaeota archaeon]|nr:50S ribosomal protein L18 [Candidatus Micrarchaeota archaeon]
MKISTNFIMPFRRRRQGKTNYAKRLAFVKAGQTRMVVRKSNRGFTIQFVNYDEKGDRTVYSMHSSQLKKVCDFPVKCNTPTAYLAGLYAGAQAKSKGIKNAIADINNTASKGAVVFAAVKGAIDAGLEIPFGEEILVAERIDGSHLKLKKEFDEAKEKILASKSPKGSK